MSGGAVELRPTIDRLWLEAAARADPLPHAYALWDLTHLPRSVRFVSALERGQTVGYLLVWLGRPQRPLVHWVGDARRSARLAERLPLPPFVAVVPREAEPTLRALYPHLRRTPILLLWRERGSPGPTDPEGLVRRLGRADQRDLRAWSRGGDEEERPDYASVDPSEEPVWGAYENGRLVGVTRAAVRLPQVWVVAGVYVDRESRGHGLSRRLVGAFLEEAERAGAPTGLFVREDAEAARHVYAGLGFRPIGRRFWLEVAPGSGAPSAPPGNERP